MANVLVLDLRRGARRSRGKGIGSDIWDFKRGEKYC